MWTITVFLKVWYYNFFFFFWLFNDWDYHYDWLFVFFSFFFCKMEVITTSHNYCKPQYHQEACSQFCNFTDHVSWPLTMLLIIMSTPVPLSHYASVNSLQTATKITLLNQQNSWGIWSFMTVFINLVFLAKNIVKIRIFL